MCVCVWARDPSTCATHYHVSDFFALEFRPPVVPGHRSAITDRRVLASAPLRQTAVTNVFQGRRGGGPPPHTHHPPCPTAPAPTHPHPATHTPLPSESAVTLRSRRLASLSGGAALICFSAPHPPTFRSCFTPLPRCFPFPSFTTCSLAHHAPSSWIRMWALRSFSCPVIKRLSSC